MRASLIVVAAAAAAVAAAACKSGGKRAAPAAGKDAGAGAATAADLPGCLTALERAAALPAPQRAGTILTGCPVCGPSWAPVLAADHVAEGRPVDLEGVWQVVSACGGVCRQSTGGSFRTLLADLVPGKPGSRPWRKLADDCPALMAADRDAMRFASGAWYALVTVAARMHVARSRLPATEVDRLDRALDALLLPLPPLTAPGTGLVVAPGAVDPGAPWLHVTVIDQQTFAGRLPFLALTGRGAVLVDGGAPYPGAAVASGQLAATLARLREPAGAPPPTLPDRIDDPIIIAPRAAPAARVLATVADLGEAPARLAVAPPTPSAPWRGLVAAHPLPLIAAGDGPRLRLGLRDDRIAVIGADGAVRASAPLPDGADRPARWRAAAAALARGVAVELVPGDATVAELIAAADALVAGEARAAAPAPAGAPLTGHDLPAFDPGALAGALADAPTP